MLTRIFCVLLLSCVCAIAFAQILPPPSQPYKPPTKKQLLLEGKYKQCFYNGKYNTKQRHHFFPFNTAVKVKLIAYKSFNDYPKDHDSVGEVFIPIAKNHFELNSARIEENKELTQAGIDSLTDIMYNVGYTPVKINFPLSFADTKCYEPRNAILFIDANGRVTQYIEFCFECHHYYLSSAKIKNTTYCEQKYDMLRRFFVAQGIKYGTAELAQ